MKRVLLVCLLSCAMAGAASARQVDSLQAALVTATDTVRVNMLNELAWQTWRGDPAAAEDYAQEALTLAQQINFSRGAARAHNNIALAYFQQGGYAEALTRFLRGLEGYETLNDRAGIAFSLNAIGNIYDRQGNYAMALDHFFRSLKLQEARGDKRGQANALNNVGNIYHQQGLYTEALDYHLQSLRLKEELGDESRIAGSLNNLGNLSEDQGNFAEALAYHRRALGIYEALDDRFGVAMSLNNLGNVYRRQEKEEEALAYYERSLQIKQDLGDQYGQAMSLNNMGIIYLGQGAISRAETASLRSLTVARAIGAKDLIKDASRTLYDLYATRGDFRTAYRYQSLYITYKDSLFNEDHAREIGRLEANFEIERRLVREAQEREEEERQHRIQRQRRSAILFSILGLSLLVLLAGGFHVTKLRKKNYQIRQQTDEIMLKNEENERLLLNILPGPIAERLKQGEETIADAFGEVTVLFSDLVNFTTFSSRTSASNLVYLLNDLFSGFDEIALRLGVEKIKTIGDAYMAVAGLPEHREDHAEVMAEMALSMLTELKRFNVRHGTDLHARIGLNTGSVVAGVIGRHKFVYDLWGDAVNVAARMESHGVAGRVHVSGATFARLQEQYAFEARGEIEVKGKGLMATYLLAGRAQPLKIPGAA